LEAFSFLSYDSDQLDYIDAVRLEYLNISRRVAHIPKSDESVDTWTNLMLTTPEAYNRAVDARGFPWTDIDVFHSQKIE